VSVRRVLSLVALLAALALVAIAAWRLMPADGSNASPAAAVVEPSTPLQTSEETQEQEDATLTPLPRQSVLVYYPRTEWDGLVGEEREIFGTASPGDRAKQILSDLIAGPAGEEATRALPPGTQLRQVYVLDQGVAYIDFSQDLRRGIGGGSTEELLTVYAIVDSVALNVAEIKRIGILIEGKPVETLNGHLDLRRPLPPDRSYIAAAAPEGDGILARTM
jgi:spore germination protein GerM